MKKAILLVLIGFVISSKNLNAQVSGCESQRDSLQLLYNDALGILDSVVGKKMELENLVKSRNAEITKLKSQVNELLKKNTKLEADLKQSKNR